MTDQHRARAAKVVAAFQESLDPGVRAQISQAQYEQLVLTVAEALSEERDAAAAALEELARTLRAGSDTPELGL